jgi:hypothetical protein
MPTEGRPKCPWSTQELLTLLNLLEELKTVPESPAPTRSASLASFMGFPGLAGLSADAPDQREAKKYVTAPLWCRLEANSLYSRLRRGNPAFKQLQFKFQEIMVRRCGMEARAHAEFEFLIWVLLSGQAYYDGKAGRESRHQGAGRLKLGKSPYADDRLAARRAIAELDALRSRGIRLDSYIDDHRLTRLLSELDKEMSRPRKRRETAKTPATDALKLLGRMLCVRFRLSSPVILKHFDDWLGTGINDTTIHKIASAAKKESEAEPARAGLYSGLNARV